METQLLNSVIQSLTRRTTKITVSHLNRYDLLRTQLPLVNVAENHDFQRIFSGLFQLRYIKAQHRAIYFKLMEAQKRNLNPSLPDLLFAYHEKTGRWEVSFITKLVAIINPERPVWDSLVSTRLGLGLPLQRKYETCVLAYNALEAKMRHLLSHKLLPDLRAAFATAFPQRNYQPMRILDVTIWGLG